MDPHGPIPIRLPSAEQLRHFIGGAAPGRLVRQVEVMVCSAPAAERVRALAGPTVRVIIDNRALHKRAIEIAAAILVGQEIDARTSPAGWGPRAAAQGA